VQFFLESMMTLPFTDNKKVAYKTKCPSFAIPFIGNIVPKRRLLTYEQATPRRQTMKYVA